MRSVQRPCAQVTGDISDELVQHRVVAVVGQVDGPLVGHHLCVFMREPAHGQMAVERWLGRIGVFDLDDVAVVVRVGVVAEVVLQQHLIVVVAEALVVPCLGVVEVQFLRKQRSAPRTDAAKTQHPTAVDAAQIQHAAVQHVPR